MASNTSEGKSPQPGSLQAMLARLRGMMQALKSSEPAAPEQTELLPTWDAPAKVSEQSADASQVVKGDAADPGTDQPAAVPAGPDATASASATGVAAAENEPRTTTQDSAEITQEPTAAPPALQSCPYCQAPRRGEETYCADCGWIFPAAEITTAPPSTATSQARVKERFILGERLGERGGVTRFRGLDLTSGNGVPVVILRAKGAAAVDSAPAAEVLEASSEPIPQLEPDAGRSTTRTPPAQESSSAAPVAETLDTQSPWPGIAWECALLERAGHSSLPRVIDRFSEGEYEYLVEELPAGQSLWDAWDDPQYSAGQRFTWLKQIAGALHHLHQAGAILEGLRPDIVAVAGGEHARLTDLADLLPLPLPLNPPIRATHYTAPELVLSSDRADARSDLYSFGAMLYALHLGRELTELDFEMQGVPKSIYERFPDIHPLFGRLISKTFCRDLGWRFPTEEAAGEDGTGFAELIRTLESCRRTLDHVRLDIASWTTTGMVRTGNEDTFALLHATESSENTLGDAALVLLADGMGGYEAGEVAAAMAIQAMRKYLLAQKPFASFTGAGAFLPGDKHVGDISPATERAACKELLAGAMKEANKEVFMAAHGVEARRGMGCTAEAVFAGGRDLVIGHVGDSRAYHLQAGTLVQVTRDQTWVNRMVELGAMTPQEAEEHPRRSELQQAIGGYPDVEPALYEATLKPGDWVVICSDGLSNHVAPETLKDLLQRSPSAESAARRLINLANLQGATDNATVVVIRAT